jgi:two-component system OmpR family response regulator
MRALLVEDDARLARLTADYLEEHGVRTTLASDGEAGLSLARSGEFDVVVLDLMLPSRDGFDVCRELRRASEVPIIVVTARGSEADRVLGLELGADDYLVKPFSPRELLARLRSMVRRSRGLVRTSGRELRVGRLTLYLDALRATLDGHDLALTASEFVLLRVLAERKGRVLSREQLLELAHTGSDEVFDRAIDVRISRLRAKLGDDPKRPRLLKTVRSVGYLLADEREG